MNWGYFLHGVAVVIASFIVVAVDHPHESLQRLSSSSPLPKTPLFSPSVASSFTSLELVSTVTYVQVLALEHTGSAPPVEMDPTTTLTRTIQKTLTLWSLVAAPAASSLMVSNSTQAQILILHNEYRQRHQAPPLSWDETVAASAQRFADGYDCSGSLEHSGGPYGENLAYGYTVKGGVEAWYNEGASFGFDTERNATFGATQISLFERYGHFTQMLWRQSLWVGCGTLTCPGGLYLICNYSPRGNVVGELQDNVFPPIQGG